MEPILTVQDRRVGAADLATLLDLIATHPDWHRTRLSQELCRLWGWVNENGRLKDMTARALLRKLDSAELIELPAPIRSANNRYRNQTVMLGTRALETSPIEGQLSTLQPLRVQRVASPEATRVFRGLVQQHHCLGYSGPVDENLQYLIYDRHERLLGCLLYGAAAWREADRDRFIGWDEATRQPGLSRIANNQRYLILPWVRVPHLASHLLAVTRSCYWRPLSNTPVLRAPATRRTTGYVSDRPPVAPATTAAAHPPWRAKRSGSTPCTGDSAVR